MEFEYFSSEEYENAFVHFGDIRKRIANLVVSLCKIDSMIVLDFLAGHGYLGLEVSKTSQSIKVVGIGLPNDVLTHLGIRKQLAQPEVFTSIDYVCTDGIALPFSEGSFDLVVNFLGLEDLKMTRGKEGVEKALKDLSSLVSLGGFLQLSIVEYGDTPEEQIAKGLWEAIGFDCTFFPENYYRELLEGLGLRLLNSVVFQFPKKMTSKQAKEEFEFACNEAPRIYAPFGVHAISFKELWSQFGDRIEEHGVAYWSRIRVLVFRKV
ncbi:MAG: class I SAM-dependent methyltransferase [Candidatus Thorarchaeota archaeon]